MTLWIWQSKEITRDQLAILLENERHNVIAEHIRAGSDPIQELSDTNDRTRLRKALRSSDYDDNVALNIRAAFQAIIDGKIKVIDD